MKMIKTICMIMLLMMLSAYTAYTQEEDFGLGLLPTLAPKAEYDPLAANITSTFPSQFDWRDGGWVTPVKNQGSCGSCWAFGALSVMESQIKIQSRNPGLAVDLSEQDLVSCFNTGQSFGGCRGNYLDLTANYLMSGGVTTEQCFPYVASEVSCISKCSSPQVYKLRSWDFLQYSYVHKVRWRYSNGYTLTYSLYIPSVDTIKAAVIQGPVVSAMAVYNDFFSYSAGVYEAGGSSSFAGLHAIAIIGWDDSDRSWICKNSWGTSWGDSGYFKIRWVEGNLDDAAGNKVNDSTIIGYDAIRMEAEVSDPNTPPTASFSVSPSSGHVSGIFSVDASESSDEDDSSSDLQVRWDFESDGVWDTTYSSVKAAAHQYASGGIYAITLEVLDTGGLTSTTTREVSVNEGPCVNFNLLEGRAEDPSRVYLFFSVTDCNGAPKDGLTSEDFEIYEDSEYISVYESDQTILPAPKLYTMSTVLLLDVSGSILGADALPALKKSAKTFIDSIAGEDGQEVAVYLFDGRKELKELVAFTKDKQPLHSAVASLNESAISSDPEYDKSTNLNGAVQKGLAILDGRRSGIDSAQLFTGTMVIFTDGTDRASRLPDSTAVSSVLSSAHGVFTIGLGGEIDADHLTALGKSGFLWADNVNDLDESFHQIADNISRESRKYYVLGYCSPKRADNHSVKLLVTGYDGKLVYSFSADGFGPGCTPETIESILYTGSKIAAAGETCVDTNFTVTPGAGKAPLSVQFAAVSEAESGYYWDFGDGSYSASKNPSHTYITQGTYTVTLKINSSECTKNDVITVESVTAFLGTDKSCQIEYALAGRQQAEEQAGVLRSFRDRVLAFSARGRVMTKLYYAHTLEVKKILAADGRLMKDVGDLAEKYSPLVKQALAGKQAVLTLDDAKEITAVLARIAEKAGPELKKTARFFMAEMKRDTGLSQFGMRIQK